MRSADYYRKKAPGPSINVDFTPLRLKTVAKMDPDLRPYSPRRMAPPSRYDYEDRRAVLESAGGGGARQDSLDIRRIFERN